MKHVAVSTAIILCLLMSACAPINTPPPSPTASAAEASLAAAAASISHSLVDLAAAEQSVHGQTPPPPNPASYGMNMIASIDWSGPIESLVRRIANATHYQVKILGSRPAIPILVTVSKRGKMIGDILRDAGYQCGKRANVIVYPSLHEVDLHYKG
jgi:defect-in-organelle-trafficking protein DotD